jgi:glycosyltransferase involved in cell wall biosynthesis
MTIQICFAYKHINEPWGGANNFIRALRYNMENNKDFSFVEDVEEDYDILFMNQLSKGPALGSKKHKLKDILSLQKRKKFKIVVRAINLKSNVDKLNPRSWLSAYWEDRTIIRLLHIANAVIFQSNYQKSLFCAHGYKEGKNIIIHNGADESFYLQPKQPFSNNAPLRIASATNANRKVKRHDLIAALSEIPHIEVFHAGRWPKKIKPKNVVFMGLLPRPKLQELYSTMHYFFHPAINDPCPNAMIEALSSGLPVIYNPGPGSSAEIVGPNGIAFEESNLSHTIEIARDNYHKLRSTVEKNRGQFGISRALAKYINFFKEVAQHQ